MSKNYPQKKSEKSGARMQQPGDPGAGRRKFATEQELAEATECPLGAVIQRYAVEGTQYQSVRMPDGTTCAGPECPLWAAVVQRDAQGVPVRAEIACTAGARTNAMGIIERPAQGGRP